MYQEYRIAEPEEPTFMRIEKDLLSSFFLGSLPKSGDRVEIYCTGEKDGKMNFMLRVVNTR